MSLGDYLRVLRAKKGGVTPWEIETAANLRKGLYRAMEQRYRAVGDEESIASLAEYFGVPSEELRWRMEWPRKALSQALAEAVTADQPLQLTLSNGTTVAGKVVWWDLGAVAIGNSAGGEAVVVMRHAVERWSAGPTPD